MPALIHSRRKTTRILLLAVLCVAIACHPALAQPSSADETKIRAAMVFNLTRYVEWPSWKFPDESSPLIFCILTNDPVGEEIDSLIHDRQTRSGQNQAREFIVRRVASVTSVEACHVFYAARLDKKKLMEALPVLNKAGVLSISDSPTAEWAIIALPVIENRVQILVDLRAAQQNGITLSSKLLRIATVTR